MTEEEIKIVSEMLAKIGGNWYPERAQSGSKFVSNRHREVAQLIVQAVERSRGAQQDEPDDGSQNSLGADELQVGASVLYRPPGDKRTIACRIEKLEDTRAYVVPEDREIGWVSTHSLLPLNPTRDGAPKPLASIPIGSSSEADSELEVPLVRHAKPRQRDGDATPGVKHYFSSSGVWIAFRLLDNDRYLFDRKGNWIGYFPWADNEIVSIEGQYLGTVFYENRIYRRSSPPPKKRDIGFVMDPADAPYVSHPGHAAPYAPPHGYKDVDMAQFPTTRRTWLKTGGPSNADNRSAFEIWMSKIGLGGLARAIMSMIRS
ncbi:hypothetical protein [Microvirga solisilvae]|uniref:hypothetical protein n=1 Tax=Microvirga solisilvae TaxID=2919498 RepID=UPI001FAF728D|nr:hypothetical protein [Microvirga solisilvae]